MTGFLRRWLGVFFWAKLAAWFGWHWQALPAEAEIAGRQQQGELGDSQGPVQSPAGVAADDQTPMTRERQLQRWPRTDTLLPVTELPETAVCRASRAAKTSLPQSPEVPVPERTTVTLELRVEELPPLEVEKGSEESASAAERATRQECELSPGESPPVGRGIERGVPGNPNDPAAAVDCFPIIGLIMRFSNSLSVRSG